MIESIIILLKSTSEVLAKLFTYDTNRDYPYLVILK